MAREAWTDEQRAVALSLYVQEGPREAARRTGIPLSTVADWARRRGLRTCSPETNKAKVAARMAQLEERRVVLAERALEEAGWLLDDMRLPASVGRFDKDGVHAEAEIKEPTARDKQALMTAFAIAVDKAQLLTGQATQRVETVSAEEELAEVVGTVDELRAVRERRAS